MPEDFRMKNIALVMAAFAVFATSCAAVAAEEENRVAKVEYSDLNLLSPKGVATLRHRLAAAVQQVCATSRIGRIPTDAEAECLRVARASAKERFDVAVAEASRSYQMAQAESPQAIH